MTTRVKLSSRKTAQRLNGRLKRLVGQFHCQKRNNHAEIATNTRTIEITFSFLLAEVMTIPSCAATMMIKSRSVNIVLLPAPSSAGNAEIDGSISCIHAYLLVGIAIKARNPHANSRCVKTLAITFIGAPDYLRKLVTRGQSLTMKSPYHERCGSYLTASYRAEVDFFHGLS
jgi:hypothetical protein